jgi:hypothetical protein
MKIKDRNRRHPVWVYFCLAFVISWGGSLLSVGLIFFRGDSVDLQDLCIGLMMVVGYCVVGLAMINLTSGSSSFPRTVLSKD